MAQTAQPGDFVQVHYTGKLTNGQVFDSSESRDALGFTMGKGMMIAGFEAAVLGMAVGESKTVRIPTDQAYGAASDEHIITMDRDQLPPDLNEELQPGLQLNMHDGQRHIPVVVKTLTDTTVTLDANHQLAGQDLTFDIRLVSVNEPQSDFS